MTKPLALAIKWVLIAAAVIGIFVIAAKLAEAGNTLAVVLAGIVGLGVLAIYATRRGVPLKYLAPGVLLMILFQLWPVVYTANLSFTNYGDGHLYSKEESITDIIAQSVREVPGAPRYKMSVAVEEGASAETGDLVLLLTDPDGATFVGDPSGLTPLPARRGDEGSLREDPRSTGLHAPHRARRSTPAAQICRRWRCRPATAAASSPSASPRPSRASPR